MRYYCIRWKLIWQDFPSQQSKRQYVLIFIRLRPCKIRSRWLHSWAVLGQNLHLQGQTKSSRTRLRQPMMMYDLPRVLWLLLARAQVNQFWRQFGLAWIALTSSDCLESGRTCMPLTALSRLWFLLLRGVFSTSHHQSCQCCLLTVGRRGLFCQTRTFWSP